MDQFNRNSVLAYQRAAEEFELRKQLANEELRKARQGGEAPSNVREWQYYSSLPQGQQEEYLRMKRADQIMNLGGTMGVRNPLGGGLIESYNVTPKPEDMPSFKAAQAGAAQDATNASNYQWGPEITAANTAADLRAQAGGRGGVIESEENARLAAERRAGYSKANSALQGFKQQSDLVTSTIDKAVKNIDGGWSTGYASYLSGLPNSDAGELSNYLDTIKANVGFDKLQSMRENSPTGGALGQVSDTENRLLQAVNGALDPKQSKQLKENLAVIKELYPKVMEERQKAFDLDYGGIGEQLDPVQANQAAAAAQAEKVGGYNPNANAAPQKGDIVDGYLFDGGDPNDQKNWKKIR